MHTSLRQCLSMLLLTGILMAGGFRALAQDLRPVSKSYIIQNATVFQAPGRSYQGYDVLIKDGLISAVGQDLAVPADAQMVEGDSLIVYAGFIDGLSHAGLEEPKRGERPNVKDPGNPPDEIAGITPYRDVRELLKENDKSVSDLRALGFTVTHTVPYGNMLPGKGAIILTGGNGDNGLILRENASLYSQFEGARGVYPNTVIGVMAKYRELYKQAELSKNDASRYNSSQGLKRPMENRVVEAFYPVIENTMPVAFHAEGVKDVYRAYHLQEDLGFRMILVGVKQGWDMADKIKSSGTPVFLSLDMPEWKDEARDSTLTGSKAKEYNQLFDRKEEMLKKYYGQPALFSQQAVPYGFSTAGLKSSDFRKNLLKMKEQGATDDQLLAALTTSPASLLGLSRWTGTVEPGKMANLVVTDNNFFDEESTIRYVFVEGKKYDFEEKKKKDKNGEKSEITPEGKWTFTADPGGAPATGTIEIKENNGEYSGTMNYDQGGTSFELSDISFSGTTLEFSVLIIDGGQELPFTGTLEFTADSYSGTVSSPSTGGFPISGERIPN